MPRRGVHDAPQVAVAGRARRTETDLAPGRSPAAAEPIARIISSIAAAWVLSLGFDLFLHGGLLAGLYLQPSPFLLGPEAAFRRIPLGYLAFLILTLGLYWALRRMGLRGATAGCRFGIGAGAVLWGAFAIGLYSITTVTLPLLAGWWLGQTVELGLAGGVLGAASGGVPLKRIWALVTVSVIAFVAGVVLLQSLGLAPPMKIVR